MCRKKLVVLGVVDMYVPRSCWDSNMVNASTKTKWGQEPNIPICPDGPAQEFQQKTNNGIVS